MKTPPTSILASLAALLTLCAAPVAHALTWDAGNTNNGATIDAGSGNWNTSAGNLVWNNGSGNAIWSQTSTTVGSQTAVFGSGTDGTVDQWTVTLASQMAATSLTFTNTGYKITGSTLQVATSGTVNGPITVASNKTATINSIIGYAANAVATITVNSGGTLNLGGGAGNSQYAFSGGGTVNLTAGTYSANIGKVNVPTFKQTGGTFTITPGNINGYDIGNNAGQSVNYTLTNATLTVNGNASTATVVDSYLALGRAASNTAYANTLTVQNGSTVNIGTTASRAGELRIGASTNASGQLDVQGGAVTIGTGYTANKIYFFKAGSSAGYSATMTQSGGIVTANGIQFGEVPATLDPASSATLQLSGGTNYIGAQGITLGAGVSALPVTIQLQGGTLGASTNWSSSLDMKLGTNGGGVTIQAANSGAVARNITLSGTLSNDGAVNGTLTKTGSGTLTLSGASANTFTGPTLVSAGTLDLGKASAVSSSSSVTIASGAALALTNSSSTVPNLTFAATGTLSFNVAGGYSLTVSAADGVTNSGAAGSVTIAITGSAPANGTYTLLAYSGALRGSGFSAYTLGSTPAGKSYTLNDTGSAVELIVSNPFVWTGAQSTEWSTATIAGSKNWNQGGSPADYTDGQNVLFDDTATNYTVDLSVSNVTPGNVTFSNGVTAYALQGSKAISGATPLSKAGSQTLTLLNANTYTGGTTISAGTLQLGNGTSGNDGTIASSPTIANSGALVYNQFGTNTYGGVISGSGSVTKTGSGKQILTGTNSYTGSTTISGGTLEIGGTGLLGNGTYANAITFASGANLKFSSSATNTLQTGVISGDGSITVDSAAGKLILAGANTYSGGVTIKNGTVESKTATNTLGTGTVLMGGAGSSGATFITGQSNTNAFIINAPNSGTNIIGANGAGSGFFMTGPLTLNGNLMVQSYFSSVLQSATARPILNGGMTGTGNLILDNLSGGTNTITLGVNPINPTGSITAQGGSRGSNIISAVIGANVTGVTQNSATCPLILSGANAYSGNTAISAGTVRLTATGSISNSAIIIVGTVPGTAAILDVTDAGMTLGAGQTLKGHGTVTGSITNSGTLAPGTSIGTLTFNNSLVLSAGSTNLFEVDGSTPTNDVVSLGGTVIYGGVLRLVPTGSFTNGQTFTLFSGAGATNISSFASISATGAATFSFTNGILTVVSTGSVTPAILTNSVSGNTLSLSWPAGQGWRLQMQTNSLYTGLNTNWVEEANSSVSSTNITIDSANPTVFYRLVNP